MGLFDRPVSRLSLIEQLGGFVTEATTNRLGCCSNRIEVSPELFPNRNVALAASGEAFARVGRVKRCEVPELHRHTVRVPEPSLVGSVRHHREGIQLCRQVNHRFVSVVELPFAEVQLKCQDELLSSPTRVPPRRWTVLNGETQTLKNSLNSVLTPAEIVSSEWA